MTRYSAVLKSKHRSEIDCHFNSGLRVCDVYKLLIQMGIRDFTKSQLYTYHKKHYVPQRLSNNYLYSILIKTGNHSLLNALETTKKVYETRKRCKCQEVLPFHIRRVGRVFICLKCSGWIPYDTGMYIRFKDKKGIKNGTIPHYVSATARSY